jgi:hypothetical protein
MRTRFLLFFLLLFVAQFSIYSQDIYHLQFKSPFGKDTATYHAFFSLSANGSGIVRVKTVDAKDQVTELSFEENYAIDKNGQPDQTYLYYKAVNAKVVMGKNSFNFLPVTFWFKINAGVFYDPWAVTDTAASFAPATSNFSSVEFIRYADLKNKIDLVSGFFADTSTYYQNIFRPKSKGGMLTANEKKNTHLYLVVVASTNDSTLQPNCLLDARKVVDFFSNLANNVLGLLPRNISIDSIYGNNYSRASVEIALKRIQPTENDLVIFYYSGHGFHNKKFPNKTFPFFDLRDPGKPKFYKDLETQTLNVQDIYDDIIKKGARFNLVLSDCCNDTVAAPKLKWWEIPKKKGIPTYNLDNVRALFMGLNKLPVNLLMTAASKDEEAIVTPSFNSYFTFFFLQALDTYLSPDKAAPSWSQVLSYAQSQTIKQVNSLPCTDKTNCPKQTPKPLLPGLKL